MNLNPILLKPALPVFLLFFSLQFLSAQTPGLIFESATGAGSAVLDPNGDGYTSATTAGFTTNDQTQSEISFVPMIFPMAEPNSDLGPGPDCGFTDFVQKGPGVEDAGQQYLDASNNWLFRLRMGGASPNSKSYSILIDTDQKFGSSGLNADPNYVTGNPGFEIEIVLATNFGVYVYDVNGTATPTLKRSYAGHTNYQKSIALSTECGNADYFYDFFVPFGHLTTDFGITTATPLRMVLADNMAANASTIGQQSSASDLGGIDDAAYGYNFETAFAALIDNYTPTCASCPAGLDRSSCPSVTGPIASGATSVSGVTSHGSGTTVKVYKNGSLIGTVTAGGGGAWTLTGISPALAGGDVIGASATAGGKAESIYNCNPVTVAQTCTAALPNAMECNAGKALSGTGAMPGAIIKVYYQAGNTPLTPTSGNLFSAGTITVDGSGNWLWRCVGAGQTTSCTAGGGPCLSDGQYRITQTVSGQCESEPVYVCTGTAGTSTAPTITTNPVLAGATSVSGTCVSVASPGNTIMLYADGVAIGSTTVISTTNWTVSSLNLTFGQVLTAKAMEGAKCISAASASKTVSRNSLAPTVAGTYCTASSISTVSGTCTEPAGTSIQVYDNGVAAGAATTVNAYGNWSRNGLSVVPGHTITAKATVSGGQQSAASNTVTVGNKTANAVTITSSPLIEGSASVSGTGVNGDVISLYVDGIQTGGTATVSGGAWTIGSLGAYDLYAGGTVTAKATTGGQCESTASAGVTVQCSLPSVSLAVDPANASTCAGSIEPNVQVFGAQSQTIYQLFDGAAASGTSRLGAGSTLTLSSGILNASTTLNIKAIRISPLACEAFLTDNVPVTVYAPDNTWKGVVSSDWFDPLNWCLGGGIPTSTTDIIIAGDAPYMPVINAAGAVCRSITINTGATVTTSGTHNLDVYGHWTNNGTLVPNSGTISFRGTGNQTVGGSVAGNTFYNLTINNTGTSGNDVVSLSQPATVDGALTLTDGILNTTAGLLSISATGTSGPGNNTGPSFVAGPMEKTGATAFVFPLGGGNRWARLGIGAPGTSTTFRAEYKLASYANVASMAAAPVPVLQRVSTGEYWQLDRTAGAGNVAVTLYWENAAVNGINSCPDLRPARWNGSGWENADESAVVTSAGCPAPTAESGTVATSTALSAFGPFTFGSKSAANPLPVELISFSAACKKPEVVLTWRTATETNNDYFTVERSTNAAVFQPIGQVDGAGTTASTRQYAFSDRPETAVQGTASVFYYRLRQTDFDGKFSFSPVIALSDCAAEAQEAFVYPNPSAGTIRVSGHFEETAGLEIFDLTGKRILTVKITDLSMDIRPGIPGGMFFYVIKDGDRVAGQGKLIVR